MTEPAQIRLTIDPDLRNEFKAACVLSGISMADQTAQLIARFVGDEMIDDDSFAEPDVDEPADDDPVVQPADISSLAALLEDKLAPIAGALAETATPSNISWLYDKLGKDTDRRNDALAKSIETIGTKVAAEIESSHVRWQSLITERRRDRYWLGSAVLAGMSALGLILALLSGTGIGRSLAVKLAGADNRWDAALSLAGDGSPLHALMMTETRTLLKTPEFREPYARCIDRAKLAKAPFNCTVRLTPLRPIP